LRRYHSSARSLAREAIALVVGIVTGAIALRVAQRHAGDRLGADERIPTKAPSVEEVLGLAYRDVRADDDSLTRIGTVIESRAIGMFSWQCTCGAKEGGYYHASDALHDLRSHRSIPRECPLSR